MSNFEGKERPTRDPFMDGEWGERTKSRPVIDKNPLAGVDLPGRSGRIWARTAEGRFAIAESRKLPRPAIFQRPDRTWGLRKITKLETQAGGDEEWKLYSGASRMSVILAALADDGRSEATHRRIGDTFLKENPDFVFSEDVFCRLTEHLVENNLAFTVENLTTSWNQIKSHVSSRAQEIAARQIELDTRQAAESDELEALSDTEVSEALGAIRRARANREI